MFIRPRMMAIERSRRMAPQPAHALLQFGAPRRPRSSSPSGCSARNDAGDEPPPAPRPRRTSRRRRRTAAENATSSSSEPIGGPMNVLATDSMLHMRPFARSRCSGSTIDGMNVWPQLSRSTSAQPSSSVASSSSRYRPGAGADHVLHLVGCRQRALLGQHRERDEQRERRSAARPSATMARLRSTRSVITPAGSVNTSHGRRCAAATSATSSGLRVIAVASHG